MNNVNISKVYLLDVPLESDYKNTLYFTSASAQQTYFQNNIVFSFTDFSYQRKDHFIRVPKQYDEVYKCNYVMYQNSAYSNKWFYAFITDIKYVDDGRTDIYIETDVIQTWLFDYNVKSSFVEREHVSDDTIGIHTVPEGLETGEYIINSHGTDSSNGTLCVVVATTLSPGELVYFGPNTYTGIPSGIAYYCYPLDKIRGEVNTLESYLNNLASAGKSEAVVGIFLAPQWVVTDTPGSTYITPTNIPKSFGMGIPKLTTLDSYVPHNNKLLTYPYVYINMSNGQGNNAIYHQELWEATNNLMIFNVQGCLTPGCSIRGIPYKYKGTDNPVDEGLNLGKFPQINWTTDQYTNWLTQNGVNIGVSLGASTIGVVGGLATSGATGGLSLGTALSGLQGIANTLGEVYKHSLVPPQAEGNLNSGDVVTASGNNRFHYYRMSIKQEYAQIIDKYFDMFGYKVNMVKVPNKAHRSRWWYTKTIDVNIDGDIPNNDMQKIKNCYNNGITFWRNASEIQNYSLNNSIV